MCKILLPTTTITRTISSPRTMAFKKVYKKSLNFHYHRWAEVYIPKKDLFVLGVYLKKILNTLILKT